MLVQEIMKTDIISIQKDKTIYETCQLYKQKKVGCIIIKEHDYCVGIVTERDIIERTICTGIDAKKTKISQIMTSNLKTIHALDNIERALEVMKTYQIKKLPVVKFDKLVGIITVTDISNASFDISKRVFDTWENFQWRD
jgi:CBS domain-containing protein